MANCSVPPFFGACAPASEIVPPSATAAAPLIRTDRLVSEFMSSSAKLFFASPPRHRESGFMTGHQVTRLQRTYGWDLPPALFADNRTARMEDAAGRRGQG